jgi:hypothetical protein
MHQISMSTQLREILYTDPKDMLILLPLHHTTTISVQMAAPLPEIMDSPLYRYDIPL